ncbi:hypothetical protein EON66_00845, partial [archaeon]
MTAAAQAAALAALHAPLARVFVLEPGVLLLPPSSPLIPPVCALATDGSAACYDVSAQVSQPPTTAGPFAMLCTGAHHHCGLQVDGAIVCWGANVTLAASVPHERAPFSDMACGVYHTCALDAAGDVVCWGWSPLGFATPNWLPSSVPIGSSFVPGTGDGALCLQLGRSRADAASNIACYSSGSLPNPLHSQQLHADAVYASVSPVIAHGRWTGCAVVTSDQRIACWGASLPTRDVEVRQPYDGGFVAVAVGVAHACAARADGSIACWGDTGDGRTAVSVIVSGLSAVRIGALTAGASHSCALSTSGSLYCWGGGVSSAVQLQPSTSTSLTYAVSSVRQVCSGDNFVCAITADNATTVHCFDVTVLPHNSQTLTASPLPAPLAWRGVHTLACGASHVCALTHDAGGNMLCADAVAGAPPTLSTVPPLATGMSHWSDVSAGQSHTCGLQSGAVAVGSTVHCWGVDAWLGGSAAATDILIGSSSGATWQTCKTDRTCPSLQVAAALHSRPGNRFVVLSNVTLDAPAVFDVWCMGCSLSLAPDAWLVVLSTYNSSAPPITSRAPMILTDIRVHVQHPQLAATSVFSWQLVAPMMANVTLTRVTCVDVPASLACASLFADHEANAIVDVDASDLILTSSDDSSSAHSVGGLLHVRGARHVSVRRVTAAAGQYSMQDVAVEVEASRDMPFVPLLYVHNTSEGVLIAHVRAVQHAATACVWISKAARVSVTNVSGTATHVGTLVGVNGAPAIDIAHISLSNSTCHASWLLPGVDANAASEPGFAVGCATHITPLHGHAGQLNSVSNVAANGPSCAVRVSSVTAIACAAVGAVASVTIHLDGTSSVSTLSESTASPFVNADVRLSDLMLADTHTSSPPFSLLLLSAVDINLVATLHRVVAERVAAHAPSAGVGAPANILARASTQTVDAAIVQTAICNSAGVSVSGSVTDSDNSVNSAVTCAALIAAARPRVVVSLNATTWLQCTTLGTSLGGGAVQMLAQEVHSELHIY